jgi:hypothetical protein
MTTNIVCSETPGTQAFPSTAAKDSGRQRTLIGVFHCHVDDHIAAGMTGRYEVDPQ